MLARQFTTDDAPPFFYLLEKLSIAIAGDSEGVLRAVSALAGLLAVGILLWRSRQRGDAADGWSGAYMAVAAYGVFHARQARSYAPLILLALVLVLSARDMLCGRRRAGPLLMICAVLLVLTHNVAVVLVLSSLVLWPLGAAGRPRLRSWILWHLPPLAGGDGAACKPRGADRGGLSLLAASRSAGGIAGVHDRSLGGVLSGSP